MITYRMTITNQDRCNKIVTVTGEDFHDAVAKVKAEHGSNWLVKELEIVSAQ